MLDQFHLFIWSAELSPLFFYIHFIILFSFFSPSTPPSGPGQWNTLRRSRGQAALDEEEAEAGRCCGCEGRPLSQVYDQSQVHRCLHSQHVWERSGRHHGHWPGRGQRAIQTLNWGSTSINDCVQNTHMPGIDYLSWNIWNIPKIFGQICTRELGEGGRQYRTVASSICLVTGDQMRCKELL